VAARAGVAKATIYRRWPNKEALVLDALVSVADGVPELAGISVRDDFVALIESMRKRGANSRAAGLYPYMIAEGARHPEIAARYHQVCVARRREAVRGVIRRGMASGELRADLDIDTMLLVMVAPMLVHTHVWSPGVELPEGSAAIYVDTVLDGLRQRAVS
jgi:AcrR family transcriptional regulator